MGKVSPISAKYLIKASINIDGSVDKPDVIGAIFGQTEGLLGSDLELRELQRSGKIGRIEVNLEINNGKNSGVIVVPSSLDKAETSIIAASLETIDRIGPCNSKVKVLKLEDIRVAKRGFIIEKAKTLLKDFQEDTLPDSQKITEEVAQSVRTMEIKEWGKDKLPAGPAIDESEEIILVEGRADVLNLLKQGIKNAIAINGTSIPPSVNDLCRRKTVTVFVDGDRGGDLIVKELLESTEIDYVTKAPDGKELEELTKKEIHIALRNKLAAEQVRFDMKIASKPSFKPIYQKKIPIKAPYKRNIKDDDLNHIKEKLDDLIGTRGAYILDKGFNVLGKVPQSELQATISELKDIYAIIFDGVITKELVRTAENTNINFIVGMDSKISHEETQISLLTARDLN